MQTATGSRTGGIGGAHQKKLIGLMMSLFFAFGFCTVLVDTLIPKLKAMFQLSYAEVMLTQFCFFLAYFIVSVPAGWLLTKIGYLRGVVLGLLVMAVGCMLFTPAAILGTYPGFLAALFILASGVTTVQVAANPMTASLGDPAKSHSRLTLAQAFNSVATMVGPIFGSALILKNSVALPDPATLSATALASLRQQEAQSLQLPFFGIALALIALAVLCWAVRRWAPEAKAQPMSASLRLLRNTRLALGAVSIFAYVGAEVSIGSAIANYLMEPRVLGLPIATAGSLVSVYWGLAMVGRFIGFVVLRRVRPGWVLAGCAIGAGTLAAVSGLSGGMVAAVTILSVGLFNSIMFPTIFTLAIEELGEETPQGSGILCLAIVGGAVVPLATGYAADHVGLSLALFVPVVCYVWIAFYGWLTARSAAAPATLGEVLG
ncbi:FHS family L-fucose permease-like MFS transporter [Caulobacter ginsengisoli]|uniref:FHS family L-fucose permease-like MFS transporter n=1 Tax=Caulobacter ginsengisoli TaxID=400775 RepID=A0ABU0ISC9_9CAUL|nr:sugar MFS transporter [Caulobacter ginsengisoli]MDQ0464325.1 FHS family L-fucose permease-like MFS transporter [Caulobacter ginsengisoli]